ncbi:MAG: hypothetical protein KDB61_09375 [Planctomycetes bacterium]|nr:hypothetical protein [Planctomycetota bacterium]
MSNEALIADALREAERLSERRSTQWAALLLRRLVEALDGPQDAIPSEPAKTWVGSVPATPSTGKVQTLWGNSTTEEA